MFGFTLTPSELEQAGSKGRSDDCGSIRENGLKYIPYAKEDLEVEFNTKKDQRGFSHPTTARLLCPRQMRDTFDDDPREFCREVLNGKRLISHNNWPSFLYPENGFNPDAIDEKLLRGPFVLSVCLRYKID
jgi:hypothetical protein